MYISTLISSLTLASTALAQSSMSMMSGMSMSTGSDMATGTAAAMASGTGSASSSSASTAVYVVKVSNKGGDLTFEPNNMTAPVGSMVQFQFYPKNHSVVQAAFSNPCEPINKIMSNVTGFKSGLMPTTPDSPMMPAFTIPIKDEKPIWYYCSQMKPVSHCQKGMVGVINPPADSTGKTIDAFKSMAAQFNPMMMMGSSNSSSSSSSSSSGSGSGSSGSSGSSSGTASSGSASGTGAASKAGATGASPSPSAFTGSANSLAMVGWTAFIGVGWALFM